MWLMLQYQHPSFIYSRYREHANFLFKVIKQFKAQKDCRRHTFRWCLRLEVIFFLWGVNTTVSVTTVTAVIQTAVQTQLERKWHEVFKVFPPNFLLCTFISDNFLSFFSLFDLSSFFFPVLVIPLIFSFIYFLLSALSCIFLFILSSFCSLFCFCYLILFCQFLPSFPFFPSSFFFFCPLLPSFPLLTFTSYVRSIVILCS